MPVFIRPGNNVQGPADIFVIFLKYFNYNENYCDEENKEWFFIGAKEDECELQSIRE